MREGAYSLALLSFLSDRGARFPHAPSPSWTIAHATMATHAATAPLSERIAKLQVKATSASPPARSPSPGGSLAATDSGLTRASTIKDKISRFEKKG